MAFPKLIPRGFSAVDHLVVDLHGRSSLTREEPKKLLKRLNLVAALVSSLFIKATEVRGKIILAA
jgi:hypothetical protein